MGVGTAFEKSLARALLKGSARNADEALAATKAADSAAGFSKLEEDALAAFQKENSGFPTENPKGTDFDVALGEATQAQKESARLVSVQDPSAEFRIDLQTQSPDEFNVRLIEQLRDPEYSARAIQKLEATEELSELRAIIDAGESSLRDRAFVEAVDFVKGSRARHVNMVNKVFGKLKASPRWNAKAKHWFGDSPYKDDLQFHTDRLTDPTRSDSFIQFDDPREIGLHMGTNRAAEGVISRGGIDAVLEDASVTQKAIEQIAGQLGRDVKGLERTFAQATEAHYLAKFTKEINPNIWDEVDDILEQFFTSIGGPVTDDIKFAMKSLPTPNTTPLLFRGRSGLLLDDNGGFNFIQVFEQLEEIFPAAREELDSLVLTGSRAEKTKAMTDFIERQGYDHIVYLNRVEDKGSMSIINWNPDLQLSPWDPSLTRGNAGEQAKAASAYVLSILGIGGAGAAVRSQEPGT